MYDVFLSYSRVDTEWMLRVRDSLRNHSLQVWTDENLTPGTESWKGSIAEAIENTRCVVVILSPDAKKSVWVNRELDYALAQNVGIFPIVIRGDETNAIPFLLASHQYADLRTNYGQGLANLLKALARKPGINVGQPQVAPSAPPVTPAAQQMQMVPVAPAWLPRLKRIAPFFLIVLMVIIFSRGNSRFLSQVNLLNMLNQVSYVGIPAVGLTFVVLVGGIDLSNGALIALAAMLGAVMAPEQPLMFMAVTAGAGLVAGLLHGLAVTQFQRLPLNQFDANPKYVRFGLSLLITLASAYLYRSLAAAFSPNGGSIVTLNELRDLGRWSISDIPGVFILFMVIALAAYFVLRHTPFGRRVYQIGSSSASGLSPRQISSTIIACYVIGAVCAGLGGGLLAARLNAAIPSMGMGYEITALAAVIVGGASLFGGRGSILGTVLGSIIMTIINTGLILLGVTAFAQQPAVIVVLIVFLALDLVVSATRPVPVGS